MLSPGEIAFLVMVIVAMSVFAIALAFASFVACGNRTSSVDRAPKRRNKRPNPYDVVSSTRTSESEAPVASIR